MASTSSFTQWFRDIRRSSAATQAFDSSLIRQEDVSSSVGPAELAAPTVSRAPDWLIKKEMAAAVHDCPEAVRDRMTLAIYRSRESLDLWLLRADLFQCIAKERGQLEARNRINALLPFFAQRVPERQLVPI
ncbi:MAG: hypothetical protein V4757_11610 [Pseudomonadota bacterium]